jgi:DNA helicase-2/ATP-dependent DNA helicase PcrA
VIVAEEQTREAQTDTFSPEDGFLPASSSAAVEAAVELAAKKEAEEAEKKVHPMFRRQSSNGSSRSRSASVNVEEKPKKRKRAESRQGKSHKKMKGVKEEPIEFDSDEELLEENAPSVTGTDEGENRAGSVVFSAIRYTLTFRMKPLSYFLQTSMLSTDTEDSNKDDSSQPVSPILPFFVV